MDVPANRFGAPPAVLGEEIVSQIGAYVHIPFCAHRCDYCAFVTTVGKDHLIDAYVDACVSQLTTERRASPRDASTLYFGGGTPSRLSPAAIERLVEAARLLPNAEVSMECNPEDVTPDYLSALVAAGVTRASFGLQSLQPRVLASLGRVNPPDALKRIMSSVRDSGLTSWSVDLIYGAAGERPEDFERTVRAIVEGDTPPPHLSIYALSVEPGTPLAKHPERFPNDDLQADRYLWMTEYLDRAGYVFEEISSWAKPGHECQHHATYWTGGDYLAIGTAAHGHDQGRRYWNTAGVERYIEAIQAGETPVVGEERLSDEARAFERLALQLRTAHGVPSGAIDFAALERLGSPHQLVDVRGGMARLTIHGRLLANAVVQCLVVRDD